MALEPESKQEEEMYKKQLEVRRGKPTIRFHEEEPIVQAPGQLWNWYTRVWRSRWFLFPLGIVVGMVLFLSLLLVLSSSRSSGNAVQMPKSGVITAQISRDYLTLVIAKQLQMSGLPGETSHVQVTLGHNNLVTVSGDDRLSVLGIPVTKHFTITIQLSVVACQLHARVLHASIAGIPVTGFVATFESKINQQLQGQASDLPGGFVYCTTGVLVEGNDIMVMYSATPQ
jgi:primosomal replication protein N